MSDKAVTNLKAAYSVNDARKELGGIGRDKIYQKINSGELEARRCGGRTLITGQAIMNFLNSLPTVEAA